MSAVGEFGLSLAILAAALAIVAALAAVRFQSVTALLLAKLALVGVTSMFLVSSVTLLMALVGYDFSLDYVARFTDKALPIGYRLAAFWAGQEGSLLLWAVLLAAMSSIAAFALGQPALGRQPTLGRQPAAGRQPTVGWQRSIGFSAAAIITLAVVCAFFGLLILYTANPFAPSLERVADGQGMNPLLLDPGMIVHPPLLFLGYAGFTVPFALMVAALITGQKDDRWITSTRRWALASWVLLSAGIILGARWAYTTLGWGGYWGWDAVENASLLPWLTATAFIHSMMVQQDRGMFRIWNAVLLTATFILCIFGTYLTRSGIVESVHSFGQSQVGTFFFVFLMAAILFCLVLIACRIRTLSSLRKMEALTSREGAFLASNILFGGIMLVVLVGTMYPLISKAITGTQTKLEASFYNKVVGPMGLLVVALMSLGPILSYGKQIPGRLSRGMAVPLILGGGAGVTAWATGWRSGWAVACAVIGAVAITVVVIEFARALLQRLRQENPLLALVRLIDGNHRRYGGQLAHVGVILIVTGITGSSVFKMKATADPMDAGNSTDVSGLHLTMQSIQENRGENYTALEATVLVKDSAGRMLTLKPQQRVYDKWTNERSSIVAIDSTWKKDLYIVLAGWNVDQEAGAYSQATLEVIVNPLVSWIWVGGWVLMAGSLLCLMPRFGAIFVAAPVVEEQPEPPAAAKASIGRNGVRHGKVRAGIV